MFAAAICIIQCVSLGLSIVQDDRTAISAYALQTAYAFYTFGLSVYAARTTDSQHKRSIVHMVALTFFATAVLTATLIIPSTSSPVASSTSANDIRLPLWYSMFVLYFASLIVAGFIPRGPALHFPPEQLYSAANSMKISSGRQDNVTEQLSACGPLVA